MEDELERKVLELVQGSSDPLETKEILGKFAGETRAKLLFRLRSLWGQGKIVGKRVGSGKGVWIWWRGY